PRREIEPRPSRIAHSLHRRLHRSRLGRPRDARAVERGEPAGDDLPGDEDRPDLVRAAHRARRNALWQRRDRLEVPGPARTDALSVLAELPRRCERRERLILVTGATGFVGGHVVHALRAAEEDVRALVRDPSKATRLRGWDADVAQGDMT